MPIILVKWLVFCYVFVEKFREMMEEVKEEISDKIGGKARNLRELSSIKGIKVPKFFAVPSDIRNEDIRDYIAEQLLKMPEGIKFAVRSSALIEDGDVVSCAGVFDTYLDVESDIDKIVEYVVKIREAADKKEEYVSEYSKLRGVDFVSGVGVVVQEMVEQPDYSGVVFSHSTEESDEYFHVNFAKGLGEHIVSGEENGVQLKIFRDALGLDKDKYSFLKELVGNIKEVEEHYNSKSLDIEFAIKNGDVYILQARPMTAFKDRVRELDYEFVEEKIRELNSFVGGIGDDVYGDMIDINPAELIGNNPDFINSSIFREIFSDKIVEKSRREMGYEPDNSGLMILVNNKPYISLRASANSFRPNGISKKTYNKLVDYYVSKVSANQYLQDRVEFDVFAMTEGKQLDKIINDLGNKLNNQEKDEIRNGFEELDKNLSHMVDKFIGRYGEDIKSYAKDVDVDDNSLSDKLKVLKKGTGFFVSAARLAFYQKNKMENKYGKEFVKTALGGLNTVSSKLHYKMLDFAVDKADRKEIVNEFGHLRLGQMDIFSDSYKSDSEHYFNFAYYEGLGKNQVDEEKKGILQNKKKYYELYNSVDVDTQKDIDDLNFLMQTREEVKFEFARGYDNLAEALIKTADKENINRDVLANTSIRDGVMIDKLKDKELLLFKAQKRLNDKAKGKVKMPCVINKDTNFNVIEIQENKPTYLSSDVVKSEAIYLNSENIDNITKDDIEGKVVVLDRADPGYDFIFSMNPKGLVTKVGGPASHMAIRALEHNLPACIGSGRNLKDIDGENIILDCKTGQLITMKPGGR